LKKKTQIRYVLFNKTKEVTSLLPLARAFTSLPPLAIGTLPPSHPSPYGLYLPPTPYHKEFTSLPPLAIRTSPPPHPSP